MTEDRDTGAGTSGQVSSYLQYLPAPLQEGHFIGRFLLAFEAILSGVAAHAPGRPGSPLDDAGGRMAPEWTQGLGETLKDIARYFRPQETPADFLPWLARWVAVDLREDWSEQTRRDVIASIVPLYKLRGTCMGIKQAVQLCVQEVSGTAGVDIDDWVVEDSATGRPFPHCFQVTLTVDVKQGPATIQQLYRKAEAAIELQKPAHTYYHLVLEYPPLVLLDEDPHEHPKTHATRGVYVGRNTTLGSVRMNPETGEKLPPDSASSSD